MTIDTKKVKNRRSVRYESLDELLTDAKRIANENVNALGNWSQGQIYRHLAHTMDCSIDGFDSLLSFPMRWILTLLFKKKFLTKAIPAGFKAPEKFSPVATSLEEGLVLLEQSIIRQKTDATRKPHPGFGNISNKEWNDFHLRHAEMHMSFLTTDK